MTTFRLNVVGWSFQILGTLFLLLDSIRVSIRLPREGGRLGDLPQVDSWVYHWASSIGFGCLFLGFILSGVALGLFRLQNSSTLYRVTQMEGAGHHRIQGGGIDDASDQQTEGQLEEVMRRLENLKNSDKDFLSTVYAEQMEWARHFNELIWTIGAILIPASFAGFALTFGDEKGTLVMTALASSALLFFWFWFAEWHRVLWRRSFTLTGMIEVKYNLKHSAISVRLIPE